MNTIKEKLNKLGLHELALYRDALAASLEELSMEVQPFYGMATNFEYLTEEQLEKKQEYEEVKTYYSNIISVMKDKVIEEINNINNKGNVKNTKNSKKES